MKRFQVRFHLGKGENYGKWQVRAAHGVRYYPTNVCLTMLDCQLRNHPATARRIHGGADKKVCAWVDCNEVFVSPFGDSVPGLPVSFNPRVAPHWRNLTGQNLDGKRIEVLRSNGKQLVATGERTEVVGGLVRLALPAAEEHKVWGGGR